MRNTRILAILVLALGLMVWAAAPSQAGPVGTAFTYQGRLIDANDVADGLYDFRFKLFDDPNVVLGNQVGSDVNKPDVDVIDGYFTVELDFGSGVFDGDARWLEIGVRPGVLEDPNTYTTLVPRQEVTPTPYALYAKTAGGDNDWMISGNNMYSIPSGNVGIGTNAPGAKLEVNAGNELGDLWVGGTQTTNGTEVGRLAFIGGGVGCYPPPCKNIYAAITGKMIDSGFMNGRGELLFYTKSPLTFPTGGGLEERMRITSGGKVGIGTTVPAATLDVNGVINTSSVYQIDEDTVLATASSNTFVGIGPGANNSTGSLNTFLGYYAGHENTEGSSNTFVGRAAGVNNTTGAANTFIGDEASEGNITGSGNTYIGKSAGWASNGSGNVFIGYRAGASETGSDKLYIANGSEDSDALIYGDFSSGNISLGKTDATEGRLVVHPGYQTGIFIDSTSCSEIEIGPGTANFYASGDFYFGTRTSNDLRLVTSGVTNTRIIIKSNGNVGIGTTSPQGKLDVNGSIYQRGGVLHADYVFEPDYQLESIEEHSEFMWQNKHLAAIPKAKTDETGREIVEVGAHRKGIVEELEKAHIYIEQLHKQNKALEARLVKLESMVARLDVSQKGAMK